MRSCRKPCIPSTYRDWVKRHAHLPNGAVLCFWDFGPTDLEPYYVDSYPNPDLRGDSEEFYQGANRAEAQRVYRIVREQFGAS